MFIYSYMQTNSSYSYRLYIHIRFSVLLCILGIQLQLLLTLAELLAMMIIMMLYWLEYLFLFYLWC